MACRVGITTDPKRRKQEWEEEYPSLRDWEILESSLSYSSAQKKENEYAQKYGCASSPGGPNDGSYNWSVYKFSY